MILQVSPDQPKLSIMRGIVIYENLEKEKCIGVVPNGSISNK